MNRTLSRSLGALIGLTLLGLGLGRLWQDSKSPEASPGLILESATKTPPPSSTTPKNFVWVGVGTTLMGSPTNEVNREDWNSDEKIHQVTLTHDFWMQKTEVTQDLWTSILGSKWPIQDEKTYKTDKKGFRFIKCGKNCPAESLSWYEAIAFANLYSKHQNNLEPCYKNSQGTDYTWDDATAAHEVIWTKGYTCKGYRLPTESEWELAARGRGPHRAKKTYAGDSEKNLQTIAWYVNNSEAPDHGIDCSTWDWKDNKALKICGPQKVGQKKPNDLGLHDMIGNVWEWTWDWHGDYPARATSDPTGPAQGKKKVLRGCSWYIHASGCRAASRSEHPPEGRNGNLGLRLVRTVHDKENTP